MPHYSFFAMRLYCEPNVIDEEQHLKLDTNKSAVGMRVYACSPSTCVKAMPVHVNSGVYLVMKHID